jgi:hypothetical protein
MNSEQFDGRRRAASDLYETGERLIGIGLMTDTNCLTSSEL